MRRLYVPSGKYPPYAPTMYMLVLFISTGICGSLYGFLFLSSFPEIIKTPPILLVNCAVIFIISLGTFLVTSLAVKKLKIRNMTLVRHWSWWAAFPGWGLSWLSVYIGSNSDLGFFHFVGDRLFNVVPDILSTQPGFFSQHITRYLVVPVWILEALSLPFIIGRYSMCCAAMLFSEKNNNWPIPTWLPVPMIAELYGEMHKKAMNPDFDWAQLPTLQGYKEKNLQAISYFELSFLIRSNCWLIPLFFPGHHDENCYFGFNSLPRLDKKLGSSYMVFWVLTEEDIEIFINKFDPDKTTEATALLRKWQREKKAASDQRDLGK